jgi:16S rRNA (cytidine1402-2'-O)-methyltransferase
LPGAGVLVLVGTPIGNLGDLSPRAAETLARADVICCEDTRRTGRLLQLAGISRRDGQGLVVVNEHTEAGEIPRVLDRLGRGQQVALVSDAGMPGISDPGERLVRATVDAGYRVEVIPGPSSAVTALVASGLPSGRFAFEGFLPRKGAARTARLAEVAGEPRTVVLFEAPHRLARTLADLAEVCGADRPVVLARELTKLHEELWRGDLAGARAWVEEREPPGEIVLVLGGAPRPAPPGDDEVREALRAVLARGSSARDAADLVAGSLHIPRRRAYALAIDLRSSSRR